MPGWLSFTSARVDEEQVGFWHLLSVLYTSQTPADAALSGLPQASRLQIPSTDTGGLLLCTCRKPGFSASPLCRLGLKG